MCIKLNFLQLLELMLTLLNYRTKDIWKKTDMYTKIGYPSVIKSLITWKKLHGSSIQVRLQVIKRVIHKKNKKVWDTVFWKFDFETKNLQFLVTSSNFH